MRLWDLCTMDKIALSIGWLVGWLGALVGWLVGWLVCWFGSVTVWLFDTLALVALAAAMPVLRTGCKLRTKRSDLGSPCIVDYRLCVVLWSVLRMRCSWEPHVAQTSFHDRHGSGQLSPASQPSKHPLTIKACAVPSLTINLSINNASLGF